jgi:hypothetical protein
VIGFALFIKWSMIKDNLHLGEKGIKTYSDRNRACFHPGRRQRNGMQPGRQPFVRRSEAGQRKMHFVRKVISAVSKSGIDSEQAEKVTDAINAKAKLFEDIYAILDKEQRRVFTREFTAHMVEKTIKGYMLPKKRHAAAADK